MKNRKKEIARFIESMNVEELNSGSILLGMGEASVASLVNYQCVNKTISCQDSVNEKNCHNYDGTCADSKNSRICLDKNTSELNSNCGC